MPQPYDYSIPMPNITADALQGLQIAQAMQEQRAAQEQARRRQDIMGRLRALGTRATAQDYIGAALELPDDQEMFMETWNMLDEGKREGMFKAGSEAFTLLTPGTDGTVNTEAAIARLEEYADGFENAGDKDTARQLRDVVEVVRLNPDAARTTIGTVLAFADGERFKAIGERTAAVQNYEYFRNAVGEDFAREVVAGDDTVTTVLPNGGFYAGPKSGLADVLRQQGGGTPANLPRVSTPAEAAALPPGTRFIDPNGVERIVPGGPASAPGGFPGGGR